MNIKKSLQQEFDFPVGYQTFHKNKDFNFQLNRMHSFGVLTRDELAAAGGMIKTIDDWQSVWVDLAPDFLKADRRLAAAFSYRAAEFYALPDDPKKIEFYDQFIQLYYGAIPEDTLEKFTIPYQGGAIPGIRLSSPKDRGVIVIHGGYDSFLEELIPVGRYFTQAGYEVIMFEGPGQGAAIRKHNLYFTHEWEHPTAAVLDHFDLNNVTLVGISLGGYLALRAAAFEPRVSRVVCFDISKYNQHPEAFLHKAIYKLFFRYPGFYNWIAEKSMKNIAVEWLIHHGMYINGVESPFEWMALLENFSVADIADRVRQDVLLLAGAEDHTVNIKEFEKNRQGLINAHSVTGRIFTAEEQAQNHCQIGNVKLALDVILEWLEEG